MYDTYVYNKKVRVEKIYITRIIIKIIYIFNFIFCLKTSQVAGNDQTVSFKVLTSKEKKEIKGKKRENIEGEYYGYIERE